jgi:hypothetical protein
MWFIVPRNLARFPMQKSHFGDFHNHQDHNDLGGGSLEGIY